MGIMEKKVETTIMVFSGAMWVGSWRYIYIYIYIGGYIGIMEKKMETTIVYWG